MNKPKWFALGHAVSLSVGPRWASNDNHLCECRDDETANHIVHCVNCHDELVAALKRVRSLPVFGDNGDVRKQIDAALAKARREAVQA